MRASTWVVMLLATSFGGSAIRAVDALGTKRPILWSGHCPAGLAVSQDDGGTRSELRPVGDWGGISVMGSVTALQRENSRRRNSHIMFSDDEGRTRIQPHELPSSPTGDRQVGKYAPDGRLFITLRDRASGGRPYVRHSDRLFACDVRGSRS